LGAAQNDLEWRLSCYENLLEEVAAGGKGKSVFSGLGKVVSQRLLGSPVVLYRFSPTSFSLVPESLVGAELLAHEVKEFLSDSRIFLGNFRLVGRIEEVAAYQKWNRVRQKYMQSCAHPVFMPMEGDGFKGMMAVFVPDS